MAKTLVRVADAATAPNPLAGASAARPAATASAPAASARPASASPAQPASLVDTVTTLRRAHVTGLSTLARMGTASRAAGKSALAPVTRAAGVLWLEVTGVFFGIFGAGMGYESWLQRANLTTSGAPQLRACGTLLVALFFAWFAVGNFLRARSR